MTTLSRPRLLAATLLLALSSAAQAGDIYRLRMFFGLSIPSGGAVSLRDWRTFQREEIAATFDGFNVVDSVGYYKGEAERSKVVTVILKEEEMAKAKGLASRYAKRFGQESVMLVKVPVAEWAFIGAEYPAGSSGDPSPPR